MTSRPPSNRLFLTVLDDVIDQFGAIVDGLDLDVRRQRGLDFVEPVLHGPGDFVGVLAHQHEAQAEHDFALAVGRDRAAANLRADRHLGHVAHANRHAVVGGDDDGLDLLDVGGAADAVDRAPTAFLRGPLPPPTLRLFSWTAVDDLVERQAVFDQPVRDRSAPDTAFRMPPQLLTSAAPGTVRILRLDDPIVDRAQLGHVVARLPVTT